MKKVLVAMSGGVDSSVAAALLQKQGFFVVGGYMKNFSRESWEGVLETDCPWEKDVADVQAVCEKLNIEFQSFNFENEYRDQVIEYFFKGYASGRTPNPDIMCNKEIKFGLFLDKAMELGFDHVATGHYVRVRERKTQGSILKTFEMLKGVDPKKDQSYFLYVLNQKQLAKSLFPIGEHTKTQVRQMAREFGLPNAEKKDSQGLCFVGHINLRQFLRQRIPERTGEIVDPAGKIIGTHQGAWYYTIGQRHGLGIGGGQPYYVAQKDIDRNKITVTTLEYGGLVHHTQATVDNVHWIGETPPFPLQCHAKIRYQQPDQECLVEVAQKGYKVKFAKPQFAVAPGQAAVFYENERVLGGAVIESG